MNPVTRATHPAPVFDLARHGGAPALVTDAGTLTYGELARRVEERRRMLGDTRRLMLLEAAPEVDFVATYLAALAGRHPVLLAPAGGATSESWRALRATYDPDVVVAGDTAWQIGEFRTRSHHELHPDLALLLSTSGSTGSPKLVRLSRHNLTSNAAAIADYLGLGPSDRAATTLPLHYCYGLSVLHSHLVAGASLWLTDRSVSEPEFWSGFESAEATSFAGVPHTFELLQQCGFAERVPARLRYVTQAGGAMPPEKVREVAELGARAGFELFVMYGQTEATARMAYLPPSLAASRPATIGIPIPGGEFRLDDGELIYSGPNVMLGYATRPAELAEGRTVHELRTGDLAVQHDDGLYQVVGRRSRVAKLFGLRIDLDQVERMLADESIAARAVDRADRLAVIVRDRRHRRRALALLRDRLCVPPFAVTCQVVAEFPLTPNGKTDYPRLRDLAPGPEGQEPGDVRALYAELLARPDAGPDDSFASLGGDSLSFVEVSIRLETLLGSLPRRWPEMTVAELTAIAEPRPARRSWRMLETPALLRAVAIVLIVGTHTEWFKAPGGAHVLLALMGYNLARFQLAGGTRGDRVARVLRSMRDLMLPCALWIGGVALVSGKYDWQTALFLNNLLGEDRWSDQWQFWFLEAAMLTLLLAAVLVAVPVIHRLESAYPWGGALVLLGVTLGYRWATVGLEADAMERYSAPLVLWCIALGYVVARAHSKRQRVLASALVAVAAYGFFGDSARELTLIGALLLLVWLPGLRLPTPLTRAVGTVASASLFVYLTHWVVYPPLDADHDVLAALLSIAVGLAVWAAYTQARELLTSRRFGRRPRVLVGSLAGSR
jgi:acyl-CoA synthetase (AMP-forming)/AMP-acid ligase II